MNILANIKNYLAKIFIDEIPEEIPNELPDEIEEDKITIIERIKNIFKKKTKEKESKTIQPNYKKYINSIEALLIAEKDTNLLNNIYKESNKYNYNYNDIKLNNFYTTLVKYNNEIYWYIKLTEGLYNTKEDERYRYMKDNIKYRCLVNIETGEYQYIDYFFDTSKISSLTDEEFLNIIFKFK